MIHFHPDAEANFAYGRTSFCSGCVHALFTLCRAPVRLLRTLRRRLWS